MNVGQQARSSAIQRIVPRPIFVLVALTVAVLSAYLAYKLFPLWGINGAMPQTIVSSAGVWFGCHAAVLLEKSARTIGD